MKRFLLLIFPLLMPILQAQELPKISTPSAKTPYVERQEKEFKFYPGGKLSISISVPGSLKIIGWKKGIIRMEAEKIVYYASNEDAKAVLQNAPIRVRHNQTSATIQTSGPPNPPAAMEINLTVYVPGDKTDLAIQVDRGDFSIDTVNGWIEATIREGSLDAKSMSGYFSGSTQRGDIYVEMSDIRWRGYEFAAMTQQGSIELKLPVDYSAGLQLTTQDGKITVDYPPREVEGEIIPPEIVVKKNAQSLTAAVGDGGAPIKLATASGNITLSKREETE